MMRGETEPLLVNTTRRRDSGAGVDDEAGEEGEGEHIQLLVLKDKDEEKDDEEEDDDEEEHKPQQQQQQQQQQHESSTATTTAVSYYLSWMGEWLFPTDVPQQCQLLRIENIAVPACYLLVGLLQGLSGPLLNVYPLDLEATEAQQISIASIRSLPASCKLIFGFISDNFPIYGYRRKYYMLLGWLLSSGSIFALLLLSDTSLLRDESQQQQQSCSIRNTIFLDHQNNDTTTTTTTRVLTTTTTTATIIPDNAPSIPFLSLCIFGFGFGFWLADVMGDSIVAEKAKLEPISSRGNIQSTCYAYRFFGIMISAPISTWLYNSKGPDVVFWILAIIPLTILPLVLLFHENPNSNIPSTKQQCYEIYNTVCSRAVWQPMGFVYLYTALQIGNAAWKQFLKTSLHFTTCQLNMLYIVSTVIVYLGILAYKYYMIYWSWRKVYVCTTILNCILSSLQILLILDITFGLSYFVFALGDDVFMDFVVGIQFLPMVIMMVHLCPTGSEGASYAMFTTIHNAALILSLSLSTSLLSIWDVSEEALQAHDYSGMMKLTLLTTALQTSGIVFVGWLPQNKDELELLKVGNHSTSHIGGIIILVIIFLSLFNAIKIGFLNIVAPGWMGES